jgi:hypothetical protein
MQPDELTPLERQLAACRPSAAGLDADAMLFAAGRASVRPNPARFVWPGIAAGFAVLSLALGSGLVAERSERLALADRLTRPADVESPRPTPIQSPATPGPDSYLAARRLIERDEAWPFHTTDDASPTDSPPSPPTIRAWAGLSAELPP